MMRKVLIRHALCLIFILPLLSDIAKGASFENKNFSTISEINIRMAWEKIEITRTANDRMHTRVTYGFTGLFQNNIELAFPETEWFELENFKTYFNSIELPMYKTIAGPDKFYSLGKHNYTALHHVKAPNSTIEDNLIVNEYDYTAPFFAPGSKTDKNLPQGKYIEYILVTGATWQGTIGKLDVIFISGTNCNQIVELPNSYKGICNNGIWEFHAKDVKPDKNIELVLTDIIFR
jgi:hypothetical protein